ncbi:Meiotic nuclear division protein 1, partial [Thoreauomyces humboldtii]
DERTTLLADLASAEALKKANRAELERYKDCDPALLEAKEKATKIAKAAANRWTGEGGFCPISMMACMRITLERSSSDNIFAIQTYCSRQFGMPGQQFAEQFQIPDTFDNL